jgi:hypothetical protein
LQTYLYSGILASVAIKLFEYSKGYKMDIIKLCETPKKESYETNGLLFHKEYAIADNMTNEERNLFVKNYSMREIYAFINPCITMRRRVDTLPSGEIKYWNWDYFNVYKTRGDAALSFGDSDYWQKGISFSHWFIEAVNLRNREIELQNELKNLENTDLKDKYNNLYDTELKEKNLYRKAKKGSAPQEIIAEIQARIKAEYNNELQTIKNRIAEIKAELTA